VPTSRINEIYLQYGVKILLWLWMLCELLVAFTHITVGKKIQPKFSYMLGIHGLYQDSPPPTISLSLSLSQRRYLKYFTQSDHRILRRLCPELWPIPPITIPSQSYKMSSQTFCLYNTAEAAELFCFVLVQTRRGGGLSGNWPRAQKWLDPSLISLVVYFIGMKLRSVTLREAKNQLLPEHCAPRFQHAFSPFYYPCDKNVHNLKFRRICLGCDQRLC
jgi:hypothetical protein